MRIALVVTPPSDHHLALAAQVGVTDIVLRYPGLDLSKTIDECARVASYGMKISIVEGYIPHDDIVHGRSGRDYQISGFKKLLRNMGEASIPICCYNWMPCDDWTRTSVTIPERGGALVTGFREADDVPPNANPGPGITESALWANLEYFLDEVIPVAEDCGVSMAMHPDDPPLKVFRGHDQIMYNVRGFDRLLNLNSSPAKGLCFCQGTFAEMGADIPKTIRHFAPHIHYVHFRDVVGTAEDFRESFHDNGQTDMAAAMRSYYEFGVDTPMRPDHVPTLAGEDNANAGYAMLGRLFAVGYMRGLIHSIESPRDEGAIFQS